MVNIVRAKPSHFFVIRATSRPEASLIAKEPGPDLTLTEARTSLDLAEIPGGTPLPPYVSLIHDVITGDRSLFTSSEGLAAAWAAIEPLLRDRPPVHPYPPGSWGPVAANELPGPCGWLLGQTED